jgi:Ni/Co efflux regulator RcnB
MKKLLTIVCGLLLGASMAMAQTGGSAAKSNDTTAKTAKTSKTSKKHHKAGKKGKKTAGATTSTSPSK